MANLYETTKQNISYHLNNIFKEKELDKISVVKDFLTTASDGKKHYPKSKKITKEGINKNY